MIELRTLQLCQLDIALDIQALCNELNISCFLIGGSLLGAVRHQGFIPWDDDLDMGLLREDYDKFIESCKTRLPDYLYLQTWDTDDAYGLPFAKIMLKGTKFREEANGKAETESMIFVDVFPFDNIPEDTFRRKSQSYLNELLKRLLQYKQGYAMWKRANHKILHFIINAASNIFSVSFLKKSINHVQRHYDENDSVFVCNLNGAYRDRERLHRSGMKLCNVHFEGYEFNAPQGWDELLTNMYGDYMQLPPVDKRGNRHAATAADLGDYVIRNKVYQEMKRGNLC
ncbi:MAG: LicD family protein [Oscillospiraceae bacterium]|nr:LicD family protein [Oscillospiraceae bacterium]